MATLPEEPPCLVQGGGGRGDGPPHLLGVLKGDVNKKQQQE